VEVLIREGIGSGYGVKRFLEKASRGEPFTVGVIGGSGEPSPSSQGLRD
jgi:hypothetical protein